MKFFSIALILLIAVSCNALTKKGSTIFDYMKDGFDTVYKFEEKEIFSYGKIKHTEGITFDVLLRKLSENTPNKLIMHLENVQMRGNPDEPLTESDLASLDLPIIVKVKNDNEDLDLEHMYAMESDTKKSLDSKHDALSMMLHNMTEQINDFAELNDPISVEMNIPDMPFGNCKTKFTFKTKKSKFFIEMKSKRSDCTGDLEKDIVEDLQKYDGTDISGDSELKLGFYYDKNSGQFLRTFLNMNGRVNTEPAVNFFIGMDVHFHGFKEITQEFDESKNTKMYKETDFD